MTEPEDLAPLWTEAAEAEWEQVVSVTYSLQLAKYRNAELFDSLREAFITAFCRGAKFENERKTDIPS